MENRSVSYNGKKSTSVREIKKGGIYQWVAPNTAAGKKFKVLLIASNVYVIRYINPQILPGIPNCELVMTKEFMHAKLFDLICVHNPG